MKRIFVWAAVTAFLVLAGAAFAAGGRSSFEESSSAGRKSYAVSRTQINSASPSGNASYSTSTFSQAGEKSSRQSSGASAAQSNANPPGRKGAKP